MVAASAPQPYQSSASPDTLSLPLLRVMTLQYPVNAFLGSYIPPEQLTRDAVSTAAPPETFEAAIASAELLGPGLEGEVNVVSAAEQHYECNMPARLQHA